jgi:hypothetical protein
MSYPDPPQSAGLIKKILTPPPLLPTPSAQRKALAKGAKFGRPFSQPAQNNHRERDGAGWYGSVRRRRAEMAPPVTAIQSQSRQACGICD